MNQQTHAPLVKTEPAVAQRHNQSRWLWWLLAVVAALVLALAVGGLLLQRVVFPPRAHAVVAVDDALVQQEQFRNELNGVFQGWVRIDVHGSQRIDMGSYSKSAEHVLRNRLFVNLQTGEQRLLFPGEQQLLLPMQDISDAAPGERRQVADMPVATLYQVVRVDTNGDGRLSRQDEAQLFLTRPDGSEGVWLGTPQQVGEVDVLRAGDWLLMLTPAETAGAELARFNLRRWQADTPWVLPPLTSSARSAPPNNSN